MRPLTLQDGTEFHVTTVTVIRSIGGRKFRMEHLPPKIAIVKVKPDRHNGEPDQSPPNLGNQGGQAPQ